MEWKEMRVEKIRIFGSKVLREMIALYFSYKGDEEKNEDCDGERHGVWAEVV